MDSKDEKPHLSCQDQGYWGDRFAAPLERMNEGQIDYLVF
jgi:hypothetical protein